MARIIPLTHPDNVTLLPGAVQNWRDLEAPAAAGPLPRRLLEPLLPTGRCLVLGAVDPGFLGWLAPQVGDLTVGARSIPDAAVLGEAVPTATVRCGNLDAVLAGQGPYDLVVALDDVSRLLSLEADPVPWTDLAAQVFGAAGPGGSVALAVENDLGLHRLGAPEHPFSRDDDADWAPYATWDASRPRTQAQLDQWLADVAPSARTWVAAAGWPSPAVAMHSPAPDSPLEALLPLVAGVAREPATITAPLAARSFALAGRYRDVCPGWLVVAGPVPEDVDQLVLLDALDDDRVAAWTPASTGTLVRDIPGAPDATVRVAPRAESLADALIRAAADADTPTMRRLLTAWRMAVAASAVGGIVPAAAADARFTNIVADDPAVRLHPATADAPVEKVVWTALADFVGMLRHHGLRHPWPSGMHPSTILEACGAMAGAAVPADIGPYVAAVEDTGPHADLTRQELAASIDRKTEELRGAWSRFHWDEQRYSLYKASKAAKKVLRQARRTAGAARRKVRARLGRAGAPGDR